MVMKGWRAVSRAASQVPKTLSADHLRRKERKEKEGEGEEQGKGRGKETFLKQNTKNLRPQVSHSDTTQVAGPETS